MNFLDFYKADNLYNYIINSNNIDNEIKKSKLKREILKFFNICLDLSKEDAKNIYNWLSNLFLDDIQERLEHDDIIIFNINRIYFSVSNEQMKYHDMLTKYIKENYTIKNEITMSNFYYILSDMVEVYGIDDIKNLFKNDSKKLKKYYN